MKTLRCLLVPSLIVAVCAASLGAAASSLARLSPDIEVVLSKSAPDSSNDEQDDHPNRERMTAAAAAAAAAAAKLRR